MEVNIHQQTISAAISAGIQIDGINQSLPLYVATQEEMERFCSMCIDAGRVAEREECANLCDVLSCTAAGCADAIRARSTK
jgi:RNA-splicing ligase RtcB